MNHDALHLLLNYLFNNPATKEYFIKIYILAVNKDRSSEYLILHTSEGYPTSLDQIRTYNEKVRQGETLSQTVTRALKDDFGITEIIVFWIQMFLKPIQTDLENYCQDMGLKFWLLNRFRLKILSLISTKVGYPKMNMKKL